MIFKDHIIDISGHEWSFQCEVEGQGMYDDDGNHGGFVVQDFKLVDIILERTGIKMMVKDFDYMPPQFLRNDLKEIEKNAEIAFLEDWMNVQERAYENAHDLGYGENIIFNK